MHMIGDIENESFELIHKKGTGLLCLSYIYGHCAIYLMEKSFSI